MLYTPVKQMLNWTSFLTLNLLGIRENVYRQIMKNCHIFSFFLRGKKEWKKKNGLLFKNNSGFK